VELGTILREEYTLNVFENMVLRKICGPKGDEVTEEWRKLWILRSFIIRTHNKHYSCSQIDNNDMGWARSALWGEERSVQNFGGKM
jgi:hypothetical protein